jgi:hypothetical protein
MFLSSIYSFVYNKAMDNSFVVGRKIYQIKVKIVVIVLL